MWYNRCTTFLPLLADERESCTTYVVQPGKWLYHVCGTTCGYIWFGWMSVRRRREFLGYCASFSLISYWIFMNSDGKYFEIIDFGTSNPVVFAYNGGWLPVFLLWWVDLSASWVIEPIGLYHLCGTTSFWLYHISGTTWEVVVPQLWYNHSGYTYLFPLKITLADTSLQRSTN